MLPKSALIFWTLLLCDAGAKHQLRVHTSEALDCPLLGDHKYSTSQNLLPQRLPTFILKRLNIKSSRSRDQNMHLHLREIIIPGCYSCLSVTHLADEFSWWLDLLRSVVQLVTTNTADPGRVGSILNPVMSCRRHLILVFVASLPGDAT